MLRAFSLFNEFQTLKIVKVGKILRHVWSTIYKLNPCCSQFIKSSREGLSGGSRFSMPAGKLPTYNTVFQQNTATSRSALCQLRLWYPSKQEHSARRAAALQDSQEEIIFPNTSYLFAHFNWICLTAAVKMVIKSVWSCDELFDYSIA